ncbi:hypothetical protein H5410_060056, partial [Solanum commersonii]
AIVVFLSFDIVPFVINDKPSCALWQNLAASFVKPSRACIMSLREFLSNMKKEDQTYQQHFSLLGFKFQWMSSSFMHSP